jgi:hypothetical protein
MHTSPYTSKTHTHTYRDIHAPCRLLHMLYGQASTHQTDIFHITHTHHAYRDMYPNRLNSKYIAIIYKLRLGYNVSVHCLSQHMHRSLQAPHHTARSPGHANVGVSGQAVQIRITASCGLAVAVLSQQQVIAEPRNQPTTKAPHGLSAEC